MTCYNKEPISIYQGFGTKWDNNDLLSITFNSEISITGFGAEFIIGNVVKSYTDIQNGFSVNLTAQETGTLPLGPINGTLVLIDLENNKRPFSTQLPFLVKDWAGGDIKLDGFKITINASVQSSSLEIDIGTTNPLAINEETIRGYISVHNQDELAHAYIQDRITANTEKFSDYRTSEAQDAIDATFETVSHAEETYATKTELSNGLSSKQNIISDLSTIRANALAGKNASTTISEYGNIVTHSISEFATAAQGALAETALQSGDNITELVNNAGYITGIDSEDVSTALGYTPLSATDVSRVALTGAYSDLSGTPTIGSGTLTIQKNGSTVGSFSANATTNSTINITVPTNNVELLNGAGYITGINSSDVTTALGFTPYNSTNPNNYQTATQVSNAVDTESSLREIADNNLQSQIDAVTASSDVKDIVGTYADLEDYDTSTLGNNDIIKVLQDETHSDETTYYRWSTSTDSFSLIGEEGPYYTKSEANNTFVPANRTINGKGLYENITLTASDIGALPDSTVIPTKASDIGAVEANTAITGATKCKITYDSKGLVTAGADLQASDIPSLTLSKISDVTASASEINVLDGITATTTELNYVDGVTSAIQTQLNGKVPTSRTINSKSLSSDITLDASDIGALPDSTKYGADLSYSSNSLQLLDQDGNNLGNAVTIQSSPDIDEKSITLNSSDELQTVGVIDQNNTSTALKQWSGTKDQYDAIATKDANTVYNITDDSTPSNFANVDLSNLSQTGQAVINGKANISLSNLDSTGKNIGNWSTNVTNCITYIPQDIKLELNSGTLTLKAGSKVYVPNGAGVFDEVVIASDITYTISASSGNRVLFYVSQSNALTSTNPTYTYSGTSPLNDTWYDTNNNVIGHYTSGTLDSNKFSFPLAIINQTSGTASVDSIDQVFNGFGYIGSTVFALPGVKGLIPNGRNEDGTLKNIAFEQSKVSTYTFSGGYTGPMILGMDATGGFNADTVFFSEGKIRPAGNNWTWLNTETNKLLCNGYTESGYVDYEPLVFIFMDAYRTNDKIDWVNFKKPFCSLDYNNKSIIAGWAMPSSKNINLTLGASGASYTAPANGYFSFSKVSNGNEWANLINSTSDVRIFSDGRSGEYVYLFIPAKKGDVIFTFYTLTGSTEFFKFIYAEGDK